MPATAHSLQQLSFISVKILFCFAQGNLNKNGDIVASYELTVLHQDIISFSGGVLVSENMLDNTIFNRLNRLTYTSKSI